MITFNTIAFVLLVVSVSHVCTDMQVEADKACNQRPKFYQSTINVVNFLGEALGMPEVGDRTVYSKAHIVPADMMRTMICGQFSNFNVSGQIGEWKKEVGKLITELHTIDPEWKDVSTLKKDNSWPDFEEENKDNERWCRRMLSNFTDGDKRSEEMIAKDLSNLFQCVNSAPANLRVGYTSTNNVISDDLDPLLKYPVNDTKIVTVSHLTTKSRKYQKAYGEKYGLQYKTYNDGGIMTSDQPFRGQTNSM